MTSPRLTPRFGLSTLEHEIPLARIRRSASLEWRLPLMISGLLAVTIGSFGLFAFTEVRQSAVRATVSQMRTVLSTSLDNASRGVAVRRDSLRHLAKQPHIVQLALGTNRRESTNAAPEAKADGARRIPATLVAQVVVPTHASLVRMTGETPTPSAIAALTALIASTSARDTTVLSPFFANGDQIQYWTVAPIAENATLVGHLAELRRLQGNVTLERQLRALTGQPISVFYANADGSLWTNPEGRPIPAPFNLSSARDSFRVRDADSAMTLGVEGALAGAPWHIFFTARESAVHERADLFLQRMLLIGLLLLAVSVVGAWWVSRRVTRPLISLTRSAGRFADGHIESREVATGEDEIGALARAFNRMAARIGRSYEQLETRINESESLAEELRDRNAELSEAQRLATDARVASDRARAEAQRASLAKSEFLAMMSHELRTPLSAIAGYAEILQLGIRGPLNDAQRADLTRIQCNQAHLLRIINDILDLTQVESGQLTMDLQPVPVRILVADVEPSVLPLIRERGVRYHVDAAALDVIVLAERERLTQAIVNLVANATRFTEAGGSIVISAERLGSRARIHVTDTGVGIPAEHHEQIFQPFVQLESGASRRTQGTGLGLAISRRLVEAMDGTLTVVSAPGSGSTFSITLNAAELSVAAYENGDAQRTTSRQTVRA